jgi:signal peptide peptidase SppA
MTILMPNIAGRLFNEPLAVDAAKLSAFMAGLGGRIVAGGLVLPGVSPVDHKAFARGRPSERAGTVGEPLAAALTNAESRGAKILQRHKSVGIIPIEGTLVQKGKWLGQSSGETSYEGIRAQVALARADKSVKAVVLEVDSYGGEVAGVFETADALRQLSAEKPTLAILTDFAYSAGYLLASSARRIVMPPGGGAGSIGVVAMHIDMSKALEQQGLAVTMIHAGAHKIDGSPTAPLDPDVRAEIQAGVDESYGRFLDAVAAGRGPRMTRKAAKDTEAKTYRGQEARRVGLVDGIMEVDAAFQRFVSNFS